MKYKPIKVNRNSSPQKRSTGFSKPRGNGVLGLYPSMSGFERFWIPLIITALLVLYLLALGFVIAPFVQLSQEPDVRLRQIWIMAGVAVLLAVVDLVAFVLFWKCPFCGCSLSFDRFINFHDFGICRVCRKKIWGRFKGRRM